MPNTTTNYNLIKPLGYENYNINVPNGNMDIIDLELKTLNDAITGEEMEQRIGDTINGADSKTTPIDADQVGLMDSASGNILKKLSWANIKATLKTYFDTLYHLKTTLSATTAGNGASLIGIADATGRFTATNVEDALAETANIVSTNTGFSATNLVTNGDFANGTNGWSGNNVSLSASNNELVCTSSVLSLASGAVRVSNHVIAPNNKYYIAIKIYPKYSNILRLNVGGVYSPNISTTGGAWNNTSAIVVSTAANQNLIFYHDTSINYVIGDTFKFKDAICIDLTATFGAGKEPSLAEMDYIMSLYPNSWFDGTVNPLLTSKQIYDDKASKVQEAWIAPTLGNSFANFGGTDSIAGYMKDQFGFVHLRGKIKTGASGASPFTLPTGYRPPYDMVVPIVSNNVFGYCTITTAGVVTVYGNATYYSIGGITFKA